MRWLKKTSLIYLIVVILLNTTTCTRVQEGPRNLADVKARGKLIMLCFPHQKNLFIRTEVEVGLDHYEGIDYELMKGFAEFLGVELEVHPVKPSFESLIPELLKGRGDVIASSFSITEERKKQVDFSDPYYQVRTVVVVQTNSKITSMTDLEGKVASTVPGSSQEERMKSIQGIRFHHVDFTRWNYDVVSDGEADFTVVDETSALDVLSLYPDLKVAFALPGSDVYGYAVMPGSDLAQSLNQYLNKMKSSNQLEKIVQKYMKKLNTAPEKE